MHSFTIVAFGAALAAAQSVPPPPPVLLTTAKSAVIPVLPTPFAGVLTNQGAIIAKAPANASYTPVNGPAAVQSNLPAATYTATLPETAFNELTGTVISGSISISSAEGATGATVNIDFSNFPNVAQYGPFVYHIHDSPVPADGNCTSTMAHFDVTNAGEYYPCIVSTPQNCQTGDLAGKHGRISANSFSTSYTDNYISTDSSSPYFIGTKSIVIHTSNTTRLTCANFQVGGGSGSAPSNGTSGSNSTAPASPTTSAPAQYTGAASKVVAGTAVVGLAAFFGLLM